MGRIAPRLLIVGDNAMTRVWRIVFACRGWEVVVAANEVEGLAMFDLAPDYVILERAGDAILQRIREQGSTTRVAVLAGPAIVDAASLPDVIFPAPGDVVEVWREGAGTTAVKTLASHRSLRLSNSGQQQSQSQAV